jgi:NADH-quinone oxidoreductase subunit G
MSATATLATTAEPKTETTVAAIPMINVQVDGEWKQFPKGTRLIEACMQSGSFVPHYCYHPALSSPGNCRMCLIEMGTPKMGPDRTPEIGPDGRPVIAWSPRPAISCAIDISEGLAVRTTSPLVEECRKGVKVKKPKQVDIGKHIVLDDERCILCSRCIRFMKEVANDDVLGFVDRGSHTTLTVHPGKRLDSNYSLNTVDICPVGALTSKDFRFKMRVWFLKETKTIDTSCGTGANIVISSRENLIHRINPRENLAVNSYWMPDSHRLNYTYIHREDRLKSPVVKGASLRWKDAITATAEALKAHAGVATAIIASGRQTNEELFLTKKLAKALGTDLLDIRLRAQEGDGLLVSSDGNPNTRGAQLLGVASATPGSKLAEIAAGIATGSITSLICIGENPLHAELTEADLSKLSSFVVIDILPNSATKFASVVLPGSAAAEKRGSMININGRLQRLNRALKAPGESRDDWEILSVLLNALGAESVTSIEDLFKQMAAATPALAGLNLGKIGDQGIDLKS